ncbi:MAG: VCBS repeat-containing protein [Planctomycetota bacterium]
MKILYTIPFLLSAPAYAQTVGGSTEILHQWTGAAPYDGAYKVSGAGDVNGDGFDDLIVGADTTDPGGLSNAGSAYVYSGVDGSLLYQWDGTASGDSFGVFVSGAGDMNGDGFADLVIGARDASPGGLPNAGSAFAYSGVDGSLLYQWDGVGQSDRFGSYVSDAGDINGDGFGDVIIGARDASPGALINAGSAYAYSGADGSLLHQWDGEAASDRFGSIVSGAGDVNGDGTPDLVVGAFAADPGGLTSAGSAYVYSGADGLLLYRWDGEAEWDHFGGAVSGAGDFNGDGFDDVAVGASSASPGGLSSAGSAYVYSGADGSLLHQWDGGGPTGYFMGTSVSDAGDVNGDGTPDLLIGLLRKHNSGQGWHCAANVYSGLGGALIHEWDTEPGASSLSVQVSGAGDVNGDGFADLMLGAIGPEPAGFTNAGMVFVYDFQPFLLTNTRTISATAGGVLDITLDFPDAAASQEYITLMSIHGTGPIEYGVDIPLSLDNYLHDSAAGIYPFSTTSDLHGTLDSLGDATAVITFPAGAFHFAVGRTFWLAAVSFPTGQLPAYSSAAVAVEILP